MRLGQLVILPHYLVGILAQHDGVLVDHFRKHYFHCVCAKRSQPLKVLLHQVAYDFAHVSTDGSVECAPPYSSCPAVLFPNLRLRDLRRKLTFLSF